MSKKTPEGANSDLSVVIVSYNTRDITMECVASLLKHNGALNLEIVVVDNCSSDGSVPALRAAFPMIRVVDSPINGGFAHGNNIGFGHCSGEYILLLNPDTEVEEQTLKSALEYLKSNPEVGLVGAKISYPDGTPQNSTIRFLSLKTLFFLIFLPSKYVVRNRSMGDHRYGSLSSDETSFVDSVMGSFMMLPRRILQEVGCLDDRFFMYGEECEWCYRIKQAGYKVAYFPDAKIVHHSGASTANMSVWRAVEMTRGHILLLRFTRGPFIAWIGTLMMLFRDFVRLPYYSAQAVFNRFSWTSQAEAWWARLKFLTKAIIDLPAGQQLEN
ncbi:MAG: glycosyltransferase family 2 protein [Sphingorhabdus sp.]